jgi:hypothetical protein
MFIYINKPNFTFSFNFGFNSSNKRSKHADDCLEKLSEFNFSLIRNGRISNEAYEVARQLASSAEKYLPRSYYKRRVKPWFYTIHKAFLINRLYLYPEGREGLTPGEERSKYCENHKCLLNDLFGNKFKIQQPLLKMTKC